MKRVFVFGINIKIIIIIFILRIIISVAYEAVPVFSSGMSV